jgi:hypothetical protein
MKETEAEIRGRLAMLETLLVVTIAQLAARAAKPDETLREIMANAEDMLAAALKDAPAGNKRAAEYAQASFDHVGEAMLRHLLARTSTTSRN